LLLNGDIESDDFRQIKTGCEKNVLILEAKLANLSVKTAQITGHWKGLFPIWRSWIKPMKKLLCGGKGNPWFDFSRKIGI